VLSKERPSERLRAGPVLDERAYLGMELETCECDVGAAQKHQGVVDHHELRMHVDVFRRKIARDGRKQLDVLAQSRVERRPLKSSLVGALDEVLEDPYGLTRIGPSA